MSEPGSLLRSLSGRMTARNFHSYVINEIGVGIVSGTYAVGTALPNDAEMIAKFDVSRTVLREALKTLESKGLLEARPKVGTKVSARSRWNLFDPQVLTWHHIAGPDNFFLQSLSDIRGAVEPLAAEQAALRRSADHLRLMHYWLHQMEISLQSPQNFALADFELHQIIADASQNPFMRSVSGIIELSHASAYQGLVLQPDEPSLAKMVSRHTEIVSALEKRDAKEAREVMLQSIVDDLALSRADTN